MMKKINLALALLLLPFSGYAADPSPFDGLYVGAQLGMVYGIFQHTSNSTLDGNLFYIPPIPPFDQIVYPTQTPASDSASNLGADAGLHFGYGHVFAQHYYLGAEVNGDFQTVSVNAHSIVSDPPDADTYTATTYTGRLSNAYGVVFRPGYLVTPTLMVYLKGGIQASHLEGSSTTGYNLIPGAAVYSTTASASKEVLGWTTGVGIEKRASNHFGFRVEDLISGYEGVSANTSQFFDNGPLAKGTVNNSTHITPYTNVLMVGVDYYFG